MASKKTGNLRCSRALAGAAAVGLLAIGGTPAQAQYVLTPFSVTGYENQTIVWDIDSSGNLAGFVNDVSGSRGFLRVNGKVEFVDGPPGSLSTAVRGRNDAGLVLGTWRADPLSTRGFLLESGQYTTFMVPFEGARSMDTWALSPNGRWVLGLWEAAGTDTGQSLPFLWDRQINRFTSLPSLSGLVRDVNDVGQVIANAGSTSYLYDATNPTTGWQVLPSNPSARTFLDSGRLAGFGTFGGVRQAWIGPVGAPQPVLPLPPEEDFPWELRVANASGEMVLRTFVQTPTDFGFRHLLATPAVLPVQTSGDGTFRFDLPVFAGVPVFLDPEVAVGYRYAIGDGDPLFASVRLPDGIGDGRFELIVEGQSFAVLAGEVVEFRALGYGAGVASFEVRGIEPEAGLDPSDPQAFVTRVTFTADGRFTGTQVALTTVYPPVPEPSTAALWLVALGVGAALRRRM